MVDGPPPQGGGGGGDRKRPRRPRGGKRRGGGGGNGGGGAPAPGGVGGNGNEQRQQQQRRQQQNQAASVATAHALGAAPPRAAGIPHSNTTHHHSSNNNNQQHHNYQQKTSSTTAAHLTQTRFADLPISPLTKKALREVLKYETCTQVQAAALPPALAGRDLVCKAKTGTGKTLGFLIPAFEALLARPVSSPSSKVGILVVSPTRELAAQIAVEAEALITFHDSFGGVLSVVGGTNMSTDASRLRPPRTPAVLVATPGRLNDLLSNAPGVRDALSDLRVLVFDEADRLLDMGFRPAIDEMLGSLPPKHTRQTLLFSATYPKNIRALADYALRSGSGGGSGGGGGGGKGGSGNGSSNLMEFVDTVGDEEVQTAEAVDQRYQIVPRYADVAPALWLACRRHAAEEPDFKVIVFFVTARLTQLYAELFAAMGAPVLEMHSRKSQPQRTKAAEAFRSTSRTIMFSSDVSARGVDYPDVTLVVQVGLPSEKAQYIHRVGRTARAGKRGQGLLLLGDFEKHFLGDLLPDVPVSAAPDPTPQEAQEAHSAVAAGLDRVPEPTKDQAYRTWLGFYKGYLRALRWTPERLVAEATQFSVALRCRTVPPTIEKKTVGKMGLKGVPGLNIEGGGGGGGGGRGGGGGGGGRGGRGGGGGGGGGAFGGAGGGGGGGGLQQQQQQQQQRNFHPRPSEGTGGSPHKRREVGNGGRGGGGGGGGGGGRGGGGGFGGRY